MGGVLGNQMKSVMEENMKKQFKFQEEIMEKQLNRQLQMQQQMRGRMVAQNLARARDLFYWWGTFSGVFGILLLAGVKKSKNPAFVLPLIPMTFIVAYQYDLAMGNKMERIVAEADRILANEPHLIAIPGPSLSAEFIEEQVKKAKAKQS